MIQRMTHVFVLNDGQHQQIAEALAGPESWWGGGLENWNDRDLTRRNSSGIHSSLRELQEFHGMLDRIDPKGFEAMQSEFYSGLVRVDSRGSEPGRTWVFIDGEMASWDTDSAGNPVVQPVLRGEQVEIDLEPKLKGELVRFMMMMREFWNRFRMERRRKVGAA